MASEQNPRLRVAALVVLGLLPTAPGAIRAQPDLRQLHETFDTDPGWEGVRNRVVATDGPTVDQDFGYRSGAIGGRAVSSTTPASYGMPIGPFSFDDPLSASGRLRLDRAPGRSGLYVGFYNAARQGWRPWSALMIQLSGSQRGEDLSLDGAEGAQVWFSAVSATWQADAMVTDLIIPADGTEHSWSFRYDPEARIDLTWPHPGLERLFVRDRGSEGDLYEEARREEPGLDRDAFRRRLEAAAEQGLLIYDPRRGTDYWERQADADEFRGAITLQIDDQEPRRMYLAPGHRDEPLALDRFGVVNQQTYGRDLEFTLGDLVVNGHPIDLTADPGWEGLGNRVSFVERDFHSRQDYGYRETNRAGRAPGEIGGVLWRTEPVDPLHGYYADDVGTLSLDDPIAFSGRIAFVDGQPDSGICFGYFDHETIGAAITDEAAGYPLPHMLGVEIEGPTRVGYTFNALCSPTPETATGRSGPLFLPDRSKHDFSFVYDPAANGGVGRITVTLDGGSYHHDLTPEQRAAGARFDRFGLWNIRRGGKFVEVYLDDLTYTTRRPAGTRPAEGASEVVEVPYPEAGRKY